MCKWFVRILMVTYVIALALFLIGNFGLFGQPADPLAGVFLIPIGLPWNLVVDFTPESAWPWLTALAPIVNIWLLGKLCRRFMSWP